MSEDPVEDPVQSNEGDEASHAAKRAKINKDDGKRKGKKHCKAAAELLTSVGRYLVIHGPGPLPPFFQCGAPRHKACASSFSRPLYLRRL